jgi:hypothetical protein
MISMVFGPPREVSRLDTTGGGGVQLNVSPGVALTKAFLYPFLNFAVILLILGGKAEDENFIVCGAAESSRAGLR